MRKLRKVNGYSRSLSIRLSLWVAFIVTVIFVAAFSLMFTESREIVRHEALGKVRQTLDGTVLHIDNTLKKVEVGANNMLKVIEQHLDDPDKMLDLSHQMLENNPNLTGCSISFEPYYYPSKGRFFSAYSYNNGDSIQTENEGTENYQFHCMDWYLIPKLLDRPYWIEPFMEDASDGIVVQDIFSSYSQPIHDREGKIVGTFSVDICLDWFSDTISATKPFPNSYCILLGKGGSFLVHPDSTKQFYETIFTSSLERPDSTVITLGSAMLSGESGYRIMDVKGEQLHVFYKPFKNTGWSVAVVCPESDIFETFHQLKNTAETITVIVLVLLLILTWFIVTKNLEPLQQLAHSTHMIAERNFTGTVPDNPRPDEIGQLQRSFKTMQESLVSHIEKARHSSDTLESRNAELQRAYEHAKADERMKNVVLHNITKNMSSPVADIYASARTICDEYHNMTDDYMNAMVDKIENDAIQVSILLNDLLRTANEETSTKDVKPENQEP